jgi:hypothetical protein
VQIRPLVAIFPEARFVQTHRDPLRITVSLLTMLANGHRMIGRNIDPWPRVERARGGPRCALRLLACAHGAS